MDRRKMAAGVIGLVVVTSVGGFFAGSRITSPAEVASRTAPPDASLILVPVEERVLSADVVTRGTGRFGSPQKLSVGTSALKPNPGIVADLAIAGAQLVEGDVAANASGRPLFLLVGARTMSRDLGPGLSGDDVQQLEEALVRLGFDVGAVDGLYDESTEAGVTAWYTQHGYAPFAATTDQLAAIRARESELAAASVDVIAAADSVATAETALVSAQAASTTAAKRADSAARAVDRARADATARNAIADTELAARQATLDALRSGTAVPPPTATEVAAAEADLAAARANEAAVRATGVQLVAEAQRTLDQAPARLGAAVTAADAANAAAAADVAAKQAALDAVAGDPAATQAELAVARADLAAAQATAADVRVTGAQAVAAAQAILAVAPGALDAARSQAALDNGVAAGDVAAKQAALDNVLSPPPPSGSDIASAERDVTAAEANSETVRLDGERALDEAEGAAGEAVADVDVKGAELRAAASAVDNANLAAAAKSTVTDLAAREADLARREAGVQVPADEVVFVAIGPVRVSELLVGTGDPATGSIMTVTDALVHVDGALAVADAGLVQPGTTVQLAEPDLGIAAEGVVALVAPAPGTNGVDGFHVYFEIEVAAPPPNLVGASVRLTIPIESSGGAVLAVPVSALTLAPDGTSRVQRNAGGTTEFVAVRPGLTADGYVEVTATEGSLKAGDLVVIGVPQATRTAQDALPSDTATLPSDTTPATGEPVETVDTAGSTGVSGG